METYVRTLAQRFYLLHNLNVSLVVKSKSDFFIKTENSPTAEVNYSNFYYDTYLSFLYKDADDERVDIWFSYTEFFKLKKVFKNLAKELETKSSIMFKEQDDGTLVICADYKGNRKIPGLSDKMLYITLAVTADKNGLHQPAIQLHFTRKELVSILTIEQFLGLSLQISEMNLLLQGQLLANSFLQSKVISRINSFSYENTSFTVEE